VWVVVGLGNPGRRYHGTRHNLGFAVVDRLADRWGTRVTRVAHHALLARVDREPGPVLLVKPQTFMNVAGDTMRSLCRFYRIDPTTVVTVYDDLDLACGRVRLRPAGGAGGHRGMTSVLEGLGSDATPRVRVGIGRPPVGMDVAAWVLSRPKGEEGTVLAAACDRAADGIECLVAEGAERAMNRINQRESRHGGSPL
jgi:PTH1 family peptidyl-tRNA hydrolase